MSRHTTRLLAAGFGAVAAVLTSAAFAASAVAATSGTGGAGIEAAPVCLSHPAQPGHAYQLQTNGNIPGVVLSNQGTSTETLTLSAAPQPWGLPAMPVPGSWLSSTPVALPAGGTATVPVTLNVPASAGPGTYATRLTVSAGTGTGGVQLGSAGGTLLAFTVGIPKPAWTPAQLATAGNCWIPEPKRTPWQQATGTTYPDPPPGWHFTGSGVLIYDPPGDWVYSWHDRKHPHQVYLGKGPVVRCVNPARYPAPGGGDEIGGAAEPVTSTAAGCARWLAEWRAGTLPAEPQLDNSLPGRDPVVVTHPRAPAMLITAASRRPQPDSDNATGYGVLGLLIAVILAILWYRWRRR